MFASQLPEGVDALASTPSDGFLIWLYAFSVENVAFRLKQTRVTNKSGAAIRQEKYSL